MVCVDIGGTKVTVSIASDAGLQGQRVEPTEKGGASDALARQVLRMIEASCRQTDVTASAVGAVGVAACGPFILSNGAVELATPNICGGMAGIDRGLPNNWTTAPLEAPLRAVYGNVRVCNDALGALHAERRWGALRGFQHCAYVTWSTGIGMGLCVDGQALRGKNANAGHGGHMFVSDSNEAFCGCGNRGDVEALVAGNAMPRRFAAQGFADAAALLDAARLGKPDAALLVDDLCRIMGRALYNLVVTLDLQAISLGGSVFWHHRDFLLPRLQSHIDGKLPALTDGCRLLPAGLKDRVGDYAALALVA
ncbi:MAG: ROK family protein [Pseudomonadota bacterium]